MMSKTNALICLAGLLAVIVLATSCDCGCHESRQNWKQCSWKNINSGAKNAVVKTCPFYKKSALSYLRVVWSGNMRQNLADKCSRWFFTFNSKECAVPQPIDAVVYQSVANYILRAGQFEGYCGLLGTGLINVELRTGLCQSHNTGSPFTGWDSYSRIIVEEVDPPQA